MVRQIGHKHVETAKTDQATDELKERLLRPKRKIKHRNTLPTYCDPDWEIPKAHQPKLSTKSSQKDIHLTPNPQFRTLAEWFITFDARKAPITLWKHLQSQACFSLENPQQQRANQQQKTVRTQQYESKANQYLSVLNRASTASVLLEPIHGDDNYLLYRIPEAGRGDQRFPQMIKVSQMEGTLLSLLSSNRDNEMSSRIMSHGIEKNGLDGDLLTNQIAGLAAAFNANNRQLLALLEHYQHSQNLLQFTVNSTERHIQMSSQHKYHESLQMEIECPIQPNNELIAPLKQFIEAIILKNLENSASDVPFDRLNYFKLQEHKGNPSQPLKLLTTTHQFKAYIEAHRLRKKRTKRHLIQTACSCCGSDYQETINPFLRCKVCSLRYHRLCFDWTKGSCGNCSYQRLEKAQKKLIPQCVICHKTGMMSVQFGTNIFAHAYCLLIHNCYDIRRNQDVAEISSSLMYSEAQQENSLDEPTNTHPSYGTTLEYTLVYKQPVLMLASQETVRKDANDFYSQFKNEQISTLHPQKNKQDVEKLLQKIFVPKNSFASKQKQLSVNLTQNSSYKPSFNYLQDASLSEQRGADQYGHKTLKNSYQQEKQDLNPTLASNIIPHLGESNSLICVERLTQHHSNITTTNSDHRKCLICSDILFENYYLKQIHTDFRVHAYCAFMSGAIMQPKGQADEAELEMSPQATNNTMEPDFQKRNFRINDRLPAFKYVDTTSESVTIRERRAYMRQFRLNHRKIAFDREFNQPSLWGVE